MANRILVRSPSPDSRTWISITQITMPTKESHSQWGLSRHFHVNRMDWIHLRKGGDTIKYGKWILFAIGDGASHITTGIASIQSSLWYIWSNKILVEIEIGHSIHLRTHYYSTTDYFFSRWRRHEDMSRWTCSHGLGLDVARTCHLPKDYTYLLQRTAINEYLPRLYIHHEPTTTVLSHSKDSTQISTSNSTKDFQWSVGVYRSTRGGMRHTIAGRRRLGTMHLVRTRTNKECSWL